MADDDDISPESLGHLKWAVDSRYKSQLCSHELLCLFEEYKVKWKSKKFSRAAQDLLAVEFSLWRAAFLADKTSSRADVFDHAKKFLLRVVEDNAIAYAQDKTSREWSFNYYTRNARYSLQTLEQFWPDIIPAYEGKKRTPVERWDYCYELLDAAVKGFGRVLAEHKEAVARGQVSKEVKLAAKERRRKVRALTLADRKKPD